MSSVWPAGGICREISAAGNQDRHHRTDSDQKLHQSGRAEGLHDRRGCRGAGVRREQGSERGQNAKEKDRTGDG